VDCKRVDARGQRVREDRIDHAMTLDPALPLKGAGHNIKPEMRLAAGSMSGVAFMPMRFVLDMQALRRERLTQFFRDDIVPLHGRRL